MIEIERESPVVFRAIPEKTETRDNWTVVTAYADEGPGPWIIDLSHRPRFDCQGGDLSKSSPFGLSLPAPPGTCVFEKGVLVSRMNGTQVSLIHLAGDKSIPMPEDPRVTDITEACLCLALIGTDIFHICEKLTALDFGDSEKHPPFLVQGPFSHVPCQMICMGRGETSGILLTCSRGYGRDMVHAILDAGEEFGLRPAGEARFRSWLDRACNAPA